MEQATYRQTRAVLPSHYPDAWGTNRRWNSESETPFERCRILNPAPNPKELERVSNLFAQAFPHIGKPRIKASWAGMIDTMPDVLPIVDKASIGGLTVATGMSGHGFGIGPNMGLVIADLVQDLKPRHDLSKFLISRFRTRDS